MSKRTIVTDYIQTKLDKIDKDLFLKSIEEMPIYEQKSVILNEIEAMKDYIYTIRNNKNSYIKGNGREELSLAIKKYINNLNKIVTKYQDYYKFISLLDNYNNRQKHVDERINFESTHVNLTPEQISIFNNKNINLNFISFNDLVALIKYMIENYELIEDKNLILDMLKEINNHLIKSDYSLDEFVAISSIKNVITYKINTLDKKSPLRVELNSMKKYTKSMINVCEDIEEKSYNYMYDIVEKLLDDEHIFNRLIESIPDIVNSLDKYGNSLAYNVLVKYLDSYLLELQYKKSAISKEEYAKIYKKIVNSPNYQVSLTDKQKIDNLLNNFIDTVKEGKFSRSKFLEVISNLEELGNKEKEIIKKINFDSTELFYDNKYILNHKFNNNARVDLTKDYTIACTSSKNYLSYAYSVSKNSDESYNLKIHVTDIKEFINHNSTLDLYLRENMFNETDNWLSDEALNKLSLKKDICPTLTFSVNVSPNGKISDFKCYQSIISLDNVLSVNEFNNKIKANDLRLKQFSKVGNYLNSFNSNAKSLMEMFNTIILDNVGTYFENNKLPYIYKTQDSQDEESYMNIMSKLNVLFSKISKDDFNKIYSIICEDTNYAKYSETPKLHYSLNQKYYTDLLIPLYSYIGIYIQYLVYEFMLDNNISKENKQTWKLESKDIINKANNVKKNIRENAHKQKVLEVK